MNKLQPLLNSDPATSQNNGPFSSPVNLIRDAEPDLLKEVRIGLIKTPKQLSSQFLYDTEGSRIFQEIMGSPEY